MYEGKEYLKESFPFIEAFVICETYYIRGVFGIPFTQEVEAFCVLKGRNVGWDGR